MFKYFQSLLKNTKNKHERHKRDKAFLTEVHNSLRYTYGIPYNLFTSSDITDAFLNMRDGFIEDGIEEDQLPRVVVFLFLVTLQERMEQRANEAKKELENTADLIFSNRQRKNETTS